MKDITGHIYMLMGMKLDPDWVCDMVQTYTDLTIHLQEMLFAEEGDPDGIWYYEDMGYKQHPFMSPRMYHEISCPGTSATVGWAHAPTPAGDPAFSCGFVEPLVPGMIEAGIDCLQVIEVKAGMDLLRLYQNYGERLSFMGGIDVRVLYNNDRARDRPRAGSQDPLVKGQFGYVLHSDHSIPYNVHHDTYRYFIDKGLSWAGIKFLFGCDGRLCRHHTQIENRRFLYARSSVGIDVSGRAGTGLRGLPGGLFHLRAVRAARAANALGLDELKAHAIACRAAKAHGGIVAPPDFWHIQEIGGYAIWADVEVGRPPRTWLTAMPPWQHFKNICYHIRQADALGFKAAILLTGHYGPNWEDLNTLTALLQPFVGARLYSCPSSSDYKGFTNDGEHKGDHAGRVETSLLWALARPECVDISRIPAEYRRGEQFAMGQDAGQADRRVGERMVADEVKFWARRPARCWKSMTARSPRTTSPPLQR